MAKNTLNDVEQSDLVGHVNNFVTEVQTSTSRLKKTWLQLYKNYRIFLKQDAKSWQSKLWIPKTFTAIEQIASRTTAHNPKFNLKALQSSALQYFTSNQKEIDEALAQNKLAAEDKTELPVDIPEADVKSSRDVLNAYLSYVFTEKKLKQKIRLWDKGRLIYGTYHIKIDTDIVTEKRVRKSKDDEGNEIEIEEEVFKNVLPSINTVDIFDFGIHPLETGTVDEAYAVYHKRDDVSITELDDDTYFNLDKIDESRSKKQPLASEEIEKDNIISQDSQSKIDPNSFTLVEYWGKYSKTGKPQDEKEYIITVVDGSLLVRFEENTVTDVAGNTIRPFVAMHDQPVPGEYYAIGEAEPIMSLQDEINHLRNLRSDFNNSVLYPEWIVRKNSGVNPFNLVHRPNNIIQVGNMADIQPLNKETVPQSSYREEESINRDIQDTTSTTAFAQPGAASAFTDTATGASIRQNEQNTRMRLKIEYLDDAVSELGRKILLLAHSAIEDNIEVPNEDEFISIYKDAFKEMAMGFSPQVVSGSMAADTPSEKRNEAIARGNISLQYQEAGVPVNLAEEYKNIMENGFDVKDPDSLLSEAPEAPVPPDAPQGQPQGAPQEVAAPPVNTI